MGIFDFLRNKKSVPPAGNAPPVDKKISGPAKIVADKRAQTYDRIEAIQALAEMKTPEAAAALLKRFSFVIDPSITDQDEKDLAFHGIVAAGKDVVAAVGEYCVKAEALTWPLKILRELLDDDEYKDELLAILERFDTEYARNVEPKIQIIQALEEVVHEEVRTSVERFLEDVNETVRFHAVQTIFAQGNAESLGPMLDMLATEESVRVKNKVAEGLLMRGWVIPDERRSAAQEALFDTGGYSVAESGKVVKRGGTGSPFSL